MVEAPKAPSGVGSGRVSPLQPTRGSGERRELPSGVRGEAKPRPQTHFLHILVHITPLIEYFDFQSSSAVWTTDPTIIFVAVRSWGDCRDCPLATPLHFVATLHLAMTRSIYPTPAIGKVKVNSLRVMWDKGESYPIIWILVSYCTRY